VTRPILSPPTGFASPTIDKVERLLELLGEIEQHRYLGPRLVLHGGTALNVFHMELPRLSVDIDVLYVGSTDREIMLAERGIVRAEVESLVRRMGYRLHDPGDEHAGVTYRLTYGTDYGQDSIKVDLNFLNRSPVLGHEMRVCPYCRPQLSFKVVPYLELIAGKLKALVERRHPAVRDLYDLHRAAARDVEDRELFRALVVYYWSLADPFPCPLDVRVVERFSGEERAVESELYPVLTATERPTLGEMQHTVAGFVESLLPLDDEHEEYLRRMGELGDFQPDLLFARWPDALERARNSPAAEWKTLNLRRRPR
jgi:predicted nucleotidyltransferase component of viral defense system